MATTTKVIVQIHERTTYAQLTTDLQLRELGYESTNDSFNFNNNAGTNFTLWAKESTGVAYDNAVTLSSTVAIVGVLTATATSVFNGGLASNGNVTVTSGDLTVNGHTDIGKNVSMSLVSSGAINLRLGMLAGTPSNTSDGYIGVHNTGGPGQTAGDLILIPRTSVGAGIRFFTGLTTPVERLSIDSAGDVDIISGNLDVTAGNVVVAAGTVQITKSNTASYDPTVNNVITTMRNSQSSVDDAVVGLSLSTARTSGSNGVVNLLCVPSGSGSGDFIVQTRNGGTYQESLRVIAGGNVGIGISSPGDKLTVNGNVGVTSGNLALSTVGKRVTVATTGGTGEFYGSGGNAVLNTTTDNLILAQSGVTKVTIFNDVTIASGVELITAAAVTGAASLNIPHGTTPSSPNDGDMWSTTAGFFIRVNSGPAEQLVAGPTTGSGNIVRSASPTLTGTIVADQIDLTTLNVSNGMFLDDNDIVSFGTGNDAKMWYNGSDLIIEPDLVGTGIVQLTTGLLLAGGSISSTANDTISLYQADLTAGNTQLALRTEGTPITNGAPTITDTLAIMVNGTQYYIAVGTSP